LVCGPSSVAALIVMLKLLHIGGAGALADRTLPFHVGPR
jgi:hypothetical protein